MKKRISEIEKKILYKNNMEKILMKEIVTRFAPSPTGTLHIGGVRTRII